MFTVNQMLKLKSLRTMLPSLVFLLLLGGTHVASGAETPKYRTLASGMKVMDTKVGSGFEARPGQVATIHFTAWVSNAGVRGEKFFDSREHGQSVSFVIGTDKVMPAWNLGVVGMKPGGERQLLIPSKLGYGTRKIENVVPDNSELIFDIELVELK